MSKDWWFADIWLVRHPRPVVDAGLCYGALDVAADPDDTMRAARDLGAVVPQGAVLRCSPALRCRMLADALMALRPDLRAAGTHAWLREMGLGDWEGRRWDDIPLAEMRAWTDDFARYQTGGGQGESVAQFLDRIERGLCALPGEDCFSAEHACRLLPVSAGDEPVGAGAGLQRPLTVCITHAGVIRGVAWLLGRALQAARDGGDADRSIRPVGGVGSASGPERDGKRQAGFAGSRYPAAHEWPDFAVGYGEAWRIGVVRLSAHAAGVWRVVENAIR